MNENKGYKVKFKNFASNSCKLPFFCPREECRLISSTADDKYFREYGVCSRCFVFYIEGREKPLIDVEFYKNRLKERGY